MNYYLPFGILALGPLDLGPVSRATLDTLPYYTKGYPIPNPMVTLQKYPYLTEGRVTRVATETGPYSVTDAI